MALVTCVIGICLHTLHSEFFESLTVSTTMPGAQYLLSKGWCNGRWMDRWMEGKLGVWVDEWMDGCGGRWVDGWVCGWMDCRRIMLSLALEAFKHRAWVVRRTNL